MHTIFSINYNASNATDNVTVYPHESGDYTIVKVSDVKTDQTTTAMVTDEQIKRQFANEFGQLEYALYSKIIISNAKIEYE